MASTNDIGSAAAPSGTVAHVFAAPSSVTSVPGTGVAGLGQVTLALCIVLGAIFLCAWLARRMRNITSGRVGALTVVAEVRLGTKERAVLIQVGQTQLLVGVAPGQVSALHVLSEPLPPQTSTPAVLDASFKALLRRSLGK